MKLVRFNESRLGIETAEGIVDVTDAAGLRTDDPLVEHLRRNFPLGEVPDDTPVHDPSSVTIEAPVRRPGKIVAAPGNYAEHQEEMADVSSPGAVEWTVEDKGYFLKAPSSIIGPGDTIRLPFSDRRCDHEVELGFVMEESVTEATPEEVRDAIAGYTIVLDITVRGEQDRSNRKSYDTFTVVGPALVTPDEIGDPGALDLELAVNGETRQSANTENMIYDCGMFGSYATIGTTLEAGDLVTTGTPPGVGRLYDGDRIEATIEDIGSMTVDVEAMDRTFEEANL